MLNFCRIRATVSDLPEMPLCAQALRGTALVSARTRAPIRAAATVERSLLIPALSDVHIFIGGRRHPPGSAAPHLSHATYGLLPPPPTTGVCAHMCSLLLMRYSPMVLSYGCILH